jgi:hypothetical protein
MKRIILGGILARIVQIMLITSLKERFIGLYATSYAINHLTYIIHRRVISWYQERIKWGLLSLSQYAAPIAAINEL